MTTENASTLSIKDIFSNLTENAPEIGKYIFKILKKTVKVTFFTGKYLIYVALLLLSGLVLVNSFDRELSPEAKEFFELPKQIIDAENAYIYMSGMRAPAGEENIVTYGREHIALENIALLNQSYSSSEDINMCNWSWNLVPFKEDELQFVGNSDDVRLWQSQERGWGEDACKVMPTNHEITNTLNKIRKDNEKLISRYYGLYEYSKFSNISAWGSLEQVRKINSFLIADIAHMARQGKAEDALKLWLQDTTFWNNVTHNGHKDWIAQSFILIVLGNHLKSLPVILESDPSLVAKYYEPIKEAIKPFGPERYNISDTLKLEQATLEGQFSNMIGSSNTYLDSFGAIFFKPNDTINNLYNQSLETMSLINMPYAEFKIVSDKIVEKYNAVDDDYDFIFKWDYLYNPIGDLTLWSQWTHTDLLYAMHHKDAKTRLLNLYVDITAKGVKGDEVEEFLKYAPKELQNPLTGEPYLYDSTKNRIYYPYPEIKDFDHEIYLN